MKTIAITMDEPTLERIDEWAERQGMNRSELVREAAKDYIREKETEAEEERERKIFHRHKRRLKKQTTVLIREQAKL
ncbi:MAG TPA: ribbon-helix-helix domain-containing protein [Acidobacteriota bacterium]|nr:ribbon-helix-helix domain-containing protein [Acidobacteriota bacterium]